MTAATPVTQVVLEAGGSRVSVAPALGGKITGLRLGGREWLWTNPTLPRVAPTEAVAADDRASYLETADTGGYDECLPTVGACTLPDAPALGALAGAALPDHGELWSQPGATERVDAPAGAAAAVTRWAGRRMRYAFARTVTVQRDGAVRVDYALTSHAEAPIPFLWSSHPLLPFVPGTRLDLPVAARVRVWSERGIDLGGEGAEHRWPVLRAGGREIDFTHPAAAAHALAAAGGPAGYACKLFLDLPRTAGPAPRPARLGVEQEGARLEVTVDPAEVPTLGLWLNHDGLSPFPGRPPQPTLGFEPCIGAPDALDAALGPWNGAAWLAPDETRRWTLTWRGRAAPAST